MKSKLKLTAVFEEAEEGGYIAYIEEIPGVNTQGETLKETKENLLDALELVLETRRELANRELSDKKVIVVWKEGKYYVAQCINVDVSSFGASKQDAIKNLDEALELYFEEHAFHPNKRNMPVRIQP